MSVMSRSVWRAGTSAAQELLRRPRDWWVWRDREDHVAAEWMQPYGDPPFAVIRGERSSRAVPVVPGIFYAAVEMQRRFHTTRGQEFTNTRHTFVSAK